MDNLYCENEFENEKHFHIKGWALNLHLCSFDTEARAVFTYNSRSSLAKRKYSNSQIFKAAEELDMGCGVGGGKDSRDIFKVGVQEYITRVKQSK